MTAATDEPLLRNVGLRWALRKVLSSLTLKRIVPEGAQITIHRRVLRAKTVEGGEKCTELSEKKRRNKGWLLTLRKLPMPRVGELKRAVAGGMRGRRTPRQGRKKLNLHKKSLESVSVKGEEPD